MIGCVPISSGRKMVSGIVNRSLFMIRIWSVSETISSGFLIPPRLLDEKSGRIYSCTIGLFLASRLQKQNSVNIDDNFMVSPPQKKKKNLPTYIEILPKLCRHVAARFLDVIHNISFVHHIPLTK